MKSILQDGTDETKRNTIDMLYAALEGGLTMCTPSPEKDCAL